MSNGTGLDSMSYTNKDFQTIYPELLDLAKRLAAKWDPTVSNESDPGVVLIKLNAIIADHLNYNIDKNVLETFPVSVTQETNARQLYEQLGYNMHWYTAGTTTIRMKWISVEEGASVYAYEIPQFTQVSDEGNLHVYTILNSNKIFTNGDTVDFDAIEGTIHDYDLNGERRITSVNLDENRRLYFNDYNIAENGIYIGEYSVGNEVQFDTSGGQYGWRRVDNTATQYLGTKCYKFGVDSITNQCYLEFPEDVDELIGQGIYIKYIKTDGFDGRIAKNALSKFFTDVIADKQYDSLGISVVSGDTFSLSLNDENIYLTNIYASVGGKNPETIEDAYRGYKRTVGTFNTLVTLRDYINAVNSSGFVSNGFVCDRTDDVQSSFSVVRDENGIISNTIVSDAPEGAALSAFDLKMYLLKYSDTVQDRASYNATFDMLDNFEDTTDSSVDSVKSYIFNQKSIQHDYKPLLLSNSSNIYPLFFKNVYDVNCKIYPQYQLTNLQILDIQSKVLTALYEALNSQKVSFGDEIDYNVVYDTILGADDRIKSIILDDMTYTTLAKCAYAAGVSSVKYYDIPINGKIVDVTSAPTLSTIPSPNISTVYRNNDTYYIYDQRSMSFISTVGGASVESVIQKIQADVYAKSVIAGKSDIYFKDNKFNYSLSRDVSAVYDNITHITTSYTVGTSSTPLTTVQPEGAGNVVFYAPNLTALEEYSTYVKYLFINGVDTSEMYNTIPANTTIQLFEDQYLMLFYKEEDSDGSPYRYVVYEPGSILKTSFQINSANPGVLSDLRGTGLIFPAQSSKYNAISNLTTTLSAKNTITHMKKTETVLSSGSDGSVRKCYVYWVLNDVDYSGDKPMSTLFGASTGSSGGSVSSQSRILNPGEYVIYSFDRESYGILGSGTEVTRQFSGSVEKMSVPYIDTLDFNSNISESLTQGGLWYQFSTNQFSLKFSEQQFLIFGEGSSIEFHDVYKNNETTENPDALDVIGTNLTSITFAGGDPPINTGYIEYTNIDGTSGRIPNFWGMSISWKVGTILNLNLSKDTPMPLRSHPEPTDPTDPLESSQSLTLDGVTVITGDSTMSILASVPMTLTGGSNIDVRSMDSRGNIVKQSLMVCSPHSQEHTTVSGDVITFTAPPTDGINIIIYQPSGQYIMPMSITSNKVEVSLTSAEGNVESIGDDTTNGHKTFWLIDIGEDNSITLNFKSTDSNSDVTIGPLMAYDASEFYKRMSHTDYISDIDALGDAIKSRLDALNDKASYIYDYTYRAEENHRIDNPLDALSFFDDNHIFNKSVIGQMYLDTDDISIVNRGR